MTRREAVELAVANLGHPIRLHVLERIAQAPIAPKQLADALDGPSLGVVSYHVRELVKGGLIEEHHTEPVRGALQHYYVTTRIADRMLVALSLNSDSSDAADADVASMQAAFWRARAIELGAGEDEWHRHDEATFGGLEGG
jgi:DNA-binding transcriptional ArsR family regulator